MDAQEVKHPARAYIYSLSHPLTKEVRYIGKANDCNKRYKGHLMDSKNKNTPLYSWIRKLNKNGLFPVMEIIKETNQKDWMKDEKDLIKEYRTKGFNLLNIALGGNEPFCDIEVRRKNGIKNTTNLTGYLNKVKKIIVSDLNVVLKCNGIKAVHEWIERVDPKMKNNNQRIVINYLKEKYNYEVR